MNLNKLRLLLNNKYPDHENSSDYAALILFTDGSGRITRYTEAPYDELPEFEFSNISQLIKHLQEN